MKLIYFTKIQKESLKANLHKALDYKENQEQRLFSKIKMKKLYGYRSRPTMITIHNHLTNKCWNVPTETLPEDKQTCAAAL